MTEKMLLNFNKNFKFYPNEIQYNILRFVSVAQSDRAAVSEAAGRGFDPPRAQKINKVYS